MRITTYTVEAVKLVGLDSACKYTKNNANHNAMTADKSFEAGWIPLANILKIMRITTLAVLILAVALVGFRLQIY